LGEEGSNTLYGGVGDDTLDGGENEDVLFGGDGDDKLTMRAADTESGGDCDDVFTAEDWVNADGSFKIDQGFATITDYNAGDKIEVDVPAPSDYEIKVTGMPGAYEIKLVNSSSEIFVAKVTGGTGSLNVSDVVLK
jgi:Ca2+-binding RTX toxin-like protein